MFNHRSLGYAFVAPGIVLLIVILGFPALASLLQSFNLWGGSGTPGIGAYQKLLLDPEFRQTLLNTALFVVVVVAAHVVLGLSVALLLNLDVPGRWLFRVIAILPWTMPDIIGGLIFRFIFDTLAGGVNAVLALAGYAPVDWFGAPGLAFGTVIFAEVWRGYPYVMLILLAGLQAIPRDQYEAAEIDGVGKWKTFLHITLPNLKPMLAIAIILDAIWECRLFGMIYGMTGGGPGYATQNMSLLVYKNYFQFFDTAYASSIAVVLAALLLVLAIPYVRMTLKEES